MLISLKMGLSDLLIAKGERTIQQIKDNLEREFKMVDQGEIKSILGVKVSRQQESGILFLQQTKYIEEILERFGMSAWSWSRDTN